MNSMELVEDLRDKTGCSYTEAQAAAEQTGGDLLQSLCWLENHGKTKLIPLPMQEDEEQTAEQEEDREHPVIRAFRLLGKGFCFLGQGLLDLLHMGNRNQLVMRKRNGEREMAASLTVVILLFAAALWFTVGLILLAMFCGYRFSLEPLPGLEADAGIKTVGTEVHPEQKCETNSKST